MRLRDGHPCLGAIYRMGPEGQPYCRRCGPTQPGEVYVRVNLVCPIVERVSANWLTNKEIQEICAEIEALR